MCQSDNTGAITSGGGFSSFYPQPSYQKEAVAGYFTLAKNAGQTPIAGYNAAGRGYPDLSLAGLAYAVVIGLKFYKISGTSAGAPAIAGFFSNINAARMAIGKGPVGWVNPTLYAYSASFTNDITSGDNHCTANNICCPQGFYATPGWDPASGLGSVNYGKMQSIFLALGNTNGLKEPTTSPTLRPLSVSPTITPSSSIPTTAPTARPSTTAPSGPTNTPSFYPTNPTRSPTRLPTNPTVTPTRTPTAPTVTPSQSPSILAPTPPPALTPTTSPSRITPSPVPTIAPSYTLLVSFQAHQVSLIKELYRVTYD